MIIFPDGDDTVKFTHCETAIACLDRGFGKRQSLHRTCSVGPSGVSEENENTTMSPDMTTATTPGSSTDSPSAPSSRRRRKRASGSSAPTNNSTTENPGRNALLLNVRNCDMNLSCFHSFFQAGPDPNSNDTMAEEAPPSATCSKLGDGETADGLTSVYNLTVCFCDTDECNVHASQTRLKNQIAYAASVCNDAQTFHHISPATFFAILVWNFRSFTQYFKKETGTCLGFYEDP